MLIAIGGVGRVLSVDVNATLTNQEQTVPVVSAEVVIVEHNFQIDANSVAQAKIVKVLRHGGIGLSQVKVATVIGKVCNSIFLYEKKQKYHYIIKIQRNNQRSI